MNHFLYKLDSPRSTFPADITPAEAELMQAHVAYWARLMQQGHVIAFGPVADPAGAYGIALVKSGDAASASRFGENDPLILANAGFHFDVYPMPRLMLPAQHD